MTEKRFVYYEHKGADYILENPNTDLDFIEMLGDCLDEKEIVNRLNGLYEENKELEQQKERYKRLSEIREKEINNRILTINEFIDDYSDDYRIKNVLLDLFYSEVKEYDLSKKYMALKKENEQLRKENDMFSCELSVSANKEISRNCRIAELEEENEQLKNKIDVLEDDNETYHKSLEQLNLYTKRFIPTKCTNEFKDCKTNRYYWLDHEGNFKGCLELLNLLDCERELLESENRQLKGRLLLYEK